MTMIGFEVGPGLAANVPLSSLSRNIPLGRQTPRPGDCNDYNYDDDFDDDFDDGDDVDDEYIDIDDEDVNDDDAYDDDDVYDDQHQNGPFGHHHLLFFLPKNNG